MTARGSTEPVKSNYATPADFTPVDQYDNGGSGVTPQPAAVAGVVLSVWAIVAYVLTSRTAWFDTELAALCTVAVNAVIAWRIRSVVTPIRGLVSRQV